VKRALLFTILLVTVIFAGCTGLFKNEITLYTFTDLTETEPSPSQIIKLGVHGYVYNPIDWQGLVVQAIDQDGNSHEVEWIPGQENPNDPKSVEYEIIINTEELIQQQIAKLHIYLANEETNLLELALYEKEPVEPEPKQTVEVRLLRKGTDQQTEVYIIRSVNPGPTVMITGGVHGSETAGWMAALEIKDWEIDAGTLVVIPQANKPAIARDYRTGLDGVDLNRQFPVGKTPTTALAREIWAVVSEFQPDAFMDLHEGWGLRRLGDRFPGGTLSVGQTLITYSAGDAQAFAGYVTDYVDQYHVKNPSTYSYMVIGPPVSGSISRKVGQELNVPAFTVEPSQRETLLTTRIRWHKVFVEELLRWHGLITQDREIVPKEYNIPAA
jgi:hypothetical protein